MIMSKDNLLEALRQKYLADVAAKRDPPGAMSETALRRTFACGKDGKVKKLQAMLQALVDARLVQCDRTPVEKTIMVPLSTLLPDAYRAAKGLPGESEEQKYPDGYLGGDAVVYRFVPR